MNSALHEIIKRSKSFEDADFLPTIFGPFQRAVAMGDLPVVLYGAGSAGRQLYPVLKMHGVSPECFCDSNPSRAGELFCGLPIISIAELQQKHKNSLIVVTSGSYRDQIKQQLIDAGFYGEKILTIRDQEAMCYYTHLAQWYWPEDDLLIHEEELLNVYKILSDSKSRELFTSRIALFVKGADYGSFQRFLDKFSFNRGINESDFQQCMHATNYDSDAYLQFNNDLILLSDNEVLVDGGAYSGDSAIEFIHACEKQKVTYSKIYCFEPEPAIFAKLQENTAQYTRIALKPCGLWSHSTILKFADSSQLRLGSTQIVKGSDNNLNSTSTIEIRTLSIDECFPDSDITIIKMDIEGAEMEALRGATKTITRCRPKLIISVYHQRNDLFEIPLFIHRIVPEYKLYLRHFSRNFGETTLFAIP